MISGVVGVKAAPSPSTDLYRDGKSLARNIFNQTVWTITFPRIPKYLFMKYLWLEVTMIEESLMMTTNNRAYIEWEE